MFGVGKIGLWSIVEEGVGVIAACVPPLRPVLRLRWIRMLGFTSYGTGQGGSASGGQTSGTGGRKYKSRSRGGSGFNNSIIASKRAVRSHLAMDTFMELDEVDHRSNPRDQDDEWHACTKAGSDGESQTRIIVKTDIAVTSGPTLPGSAV
jgi:hypothetical protein